MDQQQACGICDLLVLQRGMLDCCDHLFCSSCIEDWATVTNLCPLCKSQFKFLTLVNVKASIEENAERLDEESFSYLIDEEAITCLEGDECKLRSGDDNIEDTSVACDGCDRWYHASCVGFDPGKPGGKTWHCPRCTASDSGIAEQPKEEERSTANASKNVSSLAFTFTETGESAVVISMANENTVQKEVEVDKLGVKEENIVQGDSQAPTATDRQGAEKGDIGSKEGGTSSAAVNSVPVGKQTLDSDFQVSTAIKQNTVLLSVEDGDPGDILKVGDTSSGEPAVDSSAMSMKSELEQLVEKMKLEGLLRLETEEQRDDVEDDGGGETDVCEEAERDEMDDAACDTSIEELLRIVESASSKTEESTINDLKQDEKPVTEEKQEVRTRIILRRDGDKNSDPSLAERVRLQMISASGCSAADKVGSASVSDEQFLAAYKAAIAKTEASKPKQARLDNVRRNLKRKLYGGLRGRQAYDRDWDVSFWRNKILSDKRRKTEETTEKSELLAKMGSEPAAEPIKKRVYVADCSLLPRGDKDRDKKLKKDNASTSKPDPSRPIDGSGSTSSELKTEDGQKDKRKWALELLARKNKVTAQPAQVASPGGFVLVAQLPADMRPVLDRQSRSKVPPAVRQMQLNRLLEYYLKDVEVGKNEACEAAVNAAATKEREIYGRSNSKGVYLNLCVRALNQPIKVEPEISTEETIAQALLAAGLISDSPPGSPVADDNKETELAPAETKFEETVIEPVVEPVKQATSNRGIKALLEHLNKEANVCESDEPPVAAEKQDTMSTDTAAVPVTSEPLPAEKAEEKTDSKLVGATHEHTPDDLLDDGKFEDLDSRIDRVRSNITQHLNENTPELILSDAGDKFSIHQKVESSKDRQHSKRNASHSSKNEHRSNHSSKNEHRSKNQTSDNSKEHRKKQVPEESKAKPKAPREPGVKSRPDAEQCDSSKEHPVKKQVETYIKEHIRPLYKSGVIGGEQYQWTVAKTTAKVLEYHKDTSSAEFLITEGSRVKKLAEQYLQRYAQEKKQH